jgi:hypothetical protein
LPWPCRDPSKFRKRRNPSSTISDANVNLGLSVV